MIVNINLAAFYWEDNALGTGSPAGLSGPRPAPLLHHHQTKVLIARACSTALVKQWMREKRLLYLVHIHICTYMHACILTMNIKLLNAVAKIVTLRLVF